tara:strand:+ start:589 stop:750 length:162 start_codon:yes stop_codon:yes gene_type:complete
MTIGRTYDGRYYFTVLINGREHNSFFTYATSAEARAEGLKILRNHVSRRENSK